jgi:hypothetical protein
MSDFPLVVSILQEQYKDVYALMAEDAPAHEQPVAFISGLAKLREISGDPLYIEYRERYVITHARRNTERAAKRQRVENAWELPLKEEEELPSCLTDMSAVIGDMQKAVLQRVEHMWRENQKLKSALAELETKLAVVERRKQQLETSNAYLLVCMESRRLQVGV